MTTIRLSSKGQVIIPRAIRAANRWMTGQEFSIEITQDGILLRPKSPFPPTTVNEVAGFLQYDGPAKTQDEMEQGLMNELRAHWRAGD